MRMHIHLPLAEDRLGHPHYGDSAGGGSARGESLSPDMPAVTAFAAMPGFDGGVLSLPCCLYAPPWLAFTLLSFTAMPRFPRRPSSLILLLCAGGMAWVAWWALAGGGEKEAAGAPVTRALRRGTAMASGTGTPGRGAGTAAPPGAIVRGEVGKEEFQEIMLRLGELSREAAMNKGEASPEYLAYLDGVVARMGLGPQMSTLLTSMNPERYPGAGVRLYAAIRKALENPASAALRAELMGAPAHFTPADRLSDEWYLAAGRAAPPGEYTALMASAGGPEIQTKLRRGQAHALVLTAPGEVTSAALNEYLNTGPLSFLEWHPDGSMEATRVVVESPEQTAAWHQVISLMHTLPPQADFAGLDQMLSLSNDGRPGGPQAEEMAMARAGVLSAWMQVDPPAALEYIRRFPSDIPENLASELGAAFATHDRLDAMQALITGLPPGPSRERLNNVLQDISNSPDTALDVPVLLEMEAGNR